MLNVYATLAVRLSHSCACSPSRTRMWRNAVTYGARVGPAEQGTCGICLREFGEGRGELTLFFDAAASRETRLHFEEFVHAPTCRSKGAGQHVIRRRPRLLPELWLRLGQREMDPGSLRGRGEDRSACPFCVAPAPAAPMSWSSMAVGPVLGRRHRDAPLTPTRARDRAVAVLGDPGQDRDGATSSVFLRHNSQGQKPGRQSDRGEAEGAGDLAVAG